MYVENTIFMHLDGIIIVAAPWQQHRLHAKQLIISKRQNRIYKEYMFIYICTV